MNVLYEIVHLSPADARYKSSWGGPIGEIAQRIVALIAGQNQGSYEVTFYRDTNLSAYLPDIDPETTVVVLGGMFSGDMVPGIPACIGWRQEILTKAGFRAVVDENISIPWDLTWDDIY